MYGMFWGATSFKSDISKWDVSRVSTMYSMFMDAAAFNIDISKWDVSNVVTMDYMFYHWQEASSFKQKLCGAAWVHSKATKKSMFECSSGSLSLQVCSLPPTPQSILRRPTTRKSILRRPATPQSILRRPISERELIVRAPITTSISSSNEMTCPKCDSFKKSG